MSTPVVYIYAPRDGFLSLPANPWYDHRRERMRQVEEDECHDLPGDFPHFCDVCEKGFNTEQQYRSHLGKHIWCDVPGCKFTCLRDKEWKMEMHKTTLHERDDAPDLANTDKYLAARRKKFPTSEKILTKMEEYQLRVARGDYIGKDQWKWMKRQEYLAEACSAAKPSHEDPGMEPTEGSNEHPADPRHDSSVREGNPNALRHGSITSDDDSSDESDASEVGAPERQVEQQPTPVSTPHSSSRNVPLKGKTIPRARKRKNSLFEKLTVEDRVLEKGQVLQALRYFVVTDFLKQMPKW